MEYQVSRIELEAQPAAVVRGEVGADGIAAFLGGAFGEVMGLLGSQGISPAGPPFARFEMSGELIGIEAGFPYDGQLRPVGRVELTTLPGGPAAMVMHRGPYSDVAAAYGAAEEWVESNGWEIAATPWEAYLDGPEVAEPRTIVHMPFRAR
jgi:effector-binding domain-containing protein